jgi:hypothetical protein
MATITAVVNKSHAFNLVTYAHTTKTWTVAGDATAWVKNGTGPGICWVDGSSNRNYYRVNGAVTYDGTTNTHFTTSAGPAADQGAVGTVSRTYSLTDTDAWVGGVVPGTADLGVIGAGSEFVNQVAGFGTVFSGRTVRVDPGGSYYHQLGDISGWHLIQNGGVVTLGPSSTNGGLIDVRAGMLVAVSGGNNDGGLIDVWGGAGISGTMGNNLGGTVRLRSGSVSNVTSPGANGGTWQIQGGAVLNYNNAAQQNNGLWIWESGSRGAITNPAVGVGLAGQMVIYAGAAVTGSLAGGSAGINLVNSADPTRTVLGNGQARRIRGRMTGV